MSHWRVSDPRNRPSRGPHELGRGRRRARHDPAWGQGSWRVLSLPVAVWRKPARYAPGRNRTCDLALRRRALYPLSYGRGGAASVVDGGGALAFAAGGRLCRPGGQLRVGGRCREGGGSRGNHGFTRGGRRAPQGARNALPFARTPFLGSLSAARGRQIDVRGHRRKRPLDDDWRARCGSRPAPSRSPSCRC